MEDAPALIVAGDAVSVHVGAVVGVGAGPVSAQVTVRLPLESAL
ncbi:hypothetical protein [Candidatus Nitrotoga sp. 1052]|nr:hypothetical protein [Candidatus Nitrotoga sp. 1052]